MLHDTIKKMQPFGAASLVWV